MTEKNFSGVLVPALTPFGTDLSPDKGAFVEHCKWLLEQGADGLAVFGTTSEANSLGLTERMTLLDELVEAAISARKLMPGTGACSIEDSLVLTQHAVNLGCGGCLMLPPFYYKGVSDEGLFKAFATVIDRIGSDALKIYLYHIPPVAQVPISLSLISMLLKQYPKTVVGLKDSSGDWENTKAVLTEFPGFETFAGSEVFLLDTLRNGGAGCITATGNANPAGIRNVFTNWQTDEADDLQNRITLVRKTIQKYTLVPALKVLIANMRSDPSWAKVRPPLVELSEEDAKNLIQDLEAIDFSMNSADQLATA
ncbi:MAG: dihydrodipicolinate synthase family protein [Methyloligellaceae bacterium]